jgi:alpha-beta hydrolase superfamily lysophospholipase
MQHYEFGWKNPAGKELYAQGWLPDKGTPKAIILLIHGMGEHSSRYAHVAEFLTKQGYAILANDRVGHGKSKGQRGHVANYDQLLDDIIKLHSEATRKFPGIPVFLYGHSMGGGIVLNYVIRNPKNGLKGVIATSPALQLAFEPPAFKITLGKLMRRIYPAFSQTNEINPEHISRDKAVVEAYKKDPLVHNKISAETGMGLLQWGKEIIANADKITSVPLLLLHGTGDKLTSYKGTEAFAANAINCEYSINTYDGYFHELHNEPEKKEVLDDILEWLNAKIS